MRIRVIVFYFTLAFAVSGLLAFFLLTSRNEELAVANEIYDSIVSSTTMKDVVKLQEKFMRGNWRFHDNRCTWRQGRYMVVAGFRVDDNTEQQVLNWKIMGSLPPEWLSGKNAVDQFGLDLARRLGIVVVREWNWNTRE